MVAAAAAVGDDEVDSSPLADELAVASEVAGVLVTVAVELGEAASSLDVSCPASMVERADSDIGERVGGSPPNAERTDSGIGLRVCAPATAEERAEFPIGESVCSPLAIDERADSGIGERVCAPVTAEERAGPPIGVRVCGPPANAERADSGIGIMGVGKV